MINEWEDYYKILQVHFMAEPEIIKSAYIKLSKKYHPDVNKSYGAQKAMQKINEAYETLSDPKTRTQYLIKWMSKYNALNSTKKSCSQIHQLDFAAEPCKRVLLSYLSFISKGNYDMAYDLLSEIDKKSVSKKVFIKWQSLVAEIYKLKSFECRLKNIFKDVTINNNSFQIVVELQAEVIEENLIMGRVEKDSFSKSLVFENNEWNIFLGYTNIKSIIQKFNKLASLKKIKDDDNKPFKMKSLIEWNSRFQSKNEFIKICENEQLRHNRYGNKFSIVQCCLSINQNEYKIKRNIINYTIEILSNNTRNLDVISKWKENGILILLPETDESSAYIVANKLKRILKEEINEYDFDFFAIEQKSLSFQELIKKLPK
ncbi:hypothetical protein SH2C18_38930 [Clostridium sediminicola]|uniref:J domain-containing protein n=1 Tax=Clostridium sediminicola TaxID=3114879 RepID=UPI0031F27AB0